MNAANEHWYDIQQEDERIDLLSWTKVRRRKTMEMTTRAISFIHKWIDSVYGMPWFSRYLLPGRLELWNLWKCKIVLICP